MGHLGDHVGRYWAQDVAKMRTRCILFDQVGDLGSKLGAKMGQKRFPWGGAWLNREDLGTDGGRPAAEACPVGG